MEWHEMNNGYTQAAVGADVSTEKAMIEFCKHIKERIILENDGLAWDCLRIELWADSGRMIAFPSSISTTNRIERAGCQVVFANLLAQYERLAESDLNDDAFTVALLDMEREWIDCFLDAARQVNLTGCRMQFWDGDGERPIWDGQL